MMCGRRRSPQTEDLTRATMSQFYIINDDENDIRRCNASRDDQMVIAITGVAIDGHIKGFTGIVQSVEHDAIRDQGKRWRVTMHDSNLPTH
jgi:hypothetical protein